METVVWLRLLGTLFGMQGEQGWARGLALVADSIEAGGDVDAHMSAVAAALKSGQEPDWADLMQRIEADSSRIRNA